MAAAYQQAKQNAPGAQNTAPVQEKENRAGALANLPQAAGVAVMALLLIASLFVGNFRALQRATPKDFLRQGDVKSIVGDRLDAAGNAKMVAMRAQLDQLLLDPVDNAMDALEEAKTAREISRADQALTAAMAELTGAALEGEEARNMLRAADIFAEQGSFLRQEARAYNKKAEKAEEVYEKLPTKFLLAEPDVYEGL